jgi:hypothetical protein
MEMEQILECLLSEIRTTEENKNASQAEMLAWMNVMLDAHHERMIVKMDAWMKGMEACVGKLEANPGGQVRSSA